MLPRIFVLIWPFKKKRCDADRETPPILGTVTVSMTTICIGICFSGRGSEENLTNPVLGVREGIRPAYLLLPSTSSSTSCCPDRGTEIKIGQRAQVSDTASNHDSNHPEEELKETFSLF